MQVKEEQDENNARLGTVKASRRAFQIYFSHFFLASVKLPPLYRSFPSPPSQYPRQPHPTQERDGDIHTKFTVADFQILYVDYYYYYYYYY